ncbi:hypothetical protein ATX05_09485 [Oenococcus oeni]|nr:hypothetical protein ATX05_09485 [Oenococcus oeni]
MEQEKRQLLDALSNIQSKKTAGQNFSEGQIYGKDVILTESGIGKVQAAMATGVLLVSDRLSGKESDISSRIIMIQGNKVKIKKTK